jgi:hypothetical protein
MSLRGWPETRAERVLLGSSVCQSGNSADLFFRHDAHHAPLEHLDLERDEPPPLPRQEDRFCFYAVTFSEVLQFVRKYLELRGRGLVIQT